MTNNTTTRTKRLKTSHGSFQSKNQALIEVDNLEMAKQIVTHYTMNPPAIRQRTVYVQYSNHKELKTESNPGQEVNDLLMSHESCGTLNNIFLENFGRIEPSPTIRRWSESCSPSCC